MRPLIFLAIIAARLSCGTQPQLPHMDKLSEDYVRLVLEIGQYDDDFVDAYYGPAEWQPKAERAAELPAAALIARTDSLLELSLQVNTANYSQLEKERLLMFRKQLTAVKTKLEMMSGKTYSFDEEAKLLYDAVPPHFNRAHFDSLLTQLDQALPGEGDIQSRYHRFTEDFIIPKDRLDAVFQAAIKEARKRTNHYINLPEKENFKLEYVTDKSWSGYNYYQGNAQSLIQINTDFPIYIQRAIDLASHEGYPGHHVFNALLEQHLVDSLGWKEFSVYPLFSPQSLIAEGSANYGIEVAFPGQERIAFEKEVLFPLAGLDTARADQYYQVLGLVDKLNYAGNEAARRFLNGDWSREEAAAWLEKYALMAPDRALQRTRFMEQYRSYVINYNLGKDLVAHYVESKGGTADNPDRRWAVFKELLSTPNTAGRLTAEESE